MSLTTADSKDKLLRYVREVFGFREIKVLQLLCPLQIQLGLPGT